jgi:Trk K+ transport system NAD-binding subunit
MVTNAPSPNGGRSSVIADVVGDAERVVIVGGGHVGRRLAEQLAPVWSVHHVDETTAVAHSDGYETTPVPDVTALAGLAAAGVTADDVAVVLTGRDSRSLLVTQLLRTKFGVERVCVVLDDPRNRDAFDIPGVTVVCGTEAIAEAVVATTVDDSTRGARPVRNGDARGDTGEPRESG